MVVLVVCRCALVDIMFRRKLAKDAANGGRLREFLVSLEDAGHNNNDSRLNDVPSEISLIYCYVCHRIFITPTLDGLLCWVVTLGYVRR